MPSTVINIVSGSLTFYILIPDNFLLKRKHVLLNPVNRLIEITLDNPTYTPIENTFINWDSLLAYSRLQVISDATNNNIGVSNDYYSEFLNINTGKVQPLNNKFIQELEDFKMLMQLIKSKNIDAFFIIQPLNTLYYNNLATINPAIDEVRRELKGGNNHKAYDFADFFVTDTALYDRGLLKDLMHFSNYGWYKVDQSIIKHYKLNNEK